MEFSWEALMATVFTVYFLQAPVAYWEKRFLNRQRRGLQMAFIHNWAISFGSPVFLGLINGFTVPYLNGLKSVDCVLALGIGFIVTFISYLSWRDHPENIGHVLDEKYRITKAGWVNYMYMIIQSANIFLYIFTPTQQPNTVIVVNLLFLGFLIVQNAQAFYVQKSFKPVVLELEAVTIILITILKLEKVM